MPRRTVEWKSYINIYDLMQIIQKKIIICGNISFFIVLWADIFIRYIALNPISRFLLQFYPGYIANIIIFFFITALIIWWFSQIFALPRWAWLLLLLRYFFTDTFSSFFFPPSFLDLFCCNKYMSVSFIETFVLSRETILGSFLKFLCYSISNCYCKKNYSKEEVNLVKITHIRLQKIKENVVMTSFHCLLGKIWKISSILCCYKKGKNTWLVLLLKLKKLTWHFHARF